MSHEIDALRAAMSAAAAAVRPPFYEPPQPMKYYVYCVCPIDEGWPLLSHGGYLPKAIATAAKGLGWEGDTQESGWLPMPCEGAFWPCFVWKQGNNGTTFIASPIPITFNGDVAISTTVETTLIRAPH